MRRPEYQEQDEEELAVAERDDVPDANGDEWDASPATGEQAPDQGRETDDQSEKGRDESLPEGSAEDWADESAESDRSDGSLEQPKVDERDDERGRDPSNEAPSSDQQDIGGERDESAESRIEEPEDEEAPEESEVDQSDADRDLQANVTTEPSEDIRKTDAERPPEQAEDVRDKDKDAEQIAEADDEETWERDVARAPDQRPNETDSTAEDQKEAPDAAADDKAPESPDDDVEDQHGPSSELREVDDSPQASDSPEQRDADSEDMPPVDPEQRDETTEVSKNQTDLAREHEDDSEKASEEAENDGEVESGSEDLPREYEPADGELHESTDLHDSAAQDRAERELREENFQLLGPVEGNHLNEVQQAQMENGDTAYFKSARGEARDVRSSIPDGEQCKREVAAYELDKALGFDLVPPTVERVDGELGDGSLQAQAPGEWKPMEAFDPSDQEEMRVFDYVMGNTDRHLNNYLSQADGRPAAIDNGLGFPEDSSEPLRSTWFGTGLDQPLTEGVLDRVQAVDELALSSDLKDLGLSQGAVDGVILRLAEARSGQITGRAWDGRLQDW